MPHAPVETKVKAATAASFLVSLTIALLGQLSGDVRFITFLPVWSHPLVIAAISGTVTFLSGWQAKHSPRYSVETVRQGEAEPPDG
ncbi:holin [Streptomyces albireticuli]|uniref:Holin n=1 Tax=Streptomyces albireticuli TaxID=1940 RepID=A0A2A2DDS0_9ACTN|nr:holin [Streptomyces albireticuli]